MKAGGVKREGSRGGEAARREMMNHYKGKEKSKWKWGATKEHAGLPLDEFESQARMTGGKRGKREAEFRDEVFNYCTFIEDQYDYLWQLHK